MEMKQCSAGHFFDASRYGECPYCRGHVSEPIVVERDSALGATVPAESTVAGTVAPDSFGTTPLEATVPAENWADDQENDERTVALESEEEQRLVVGWLVCIQGPDRGKSYEVHGENNFIGRSTAMDINIAGDMTISRDKPAVITYDSRSRAFYFGFMNGKSIIRLNGVPMLSTAQLKANDVIELGNTKLMFIPLCGASFDWDSAQ